MGFGRNFSKILRDKKIKIVDVSNNLGISRKTVQEWSAGRFPRKPEHLKALSKYLDVSIHYLIFGTEEEMDLVKAVFDKSETHTGVYEITVKKLNPKK